MGAFPLAVGSLPISRRKSPHELTKPAHRLMGAFPPHGAITSNALVSLQRGCSCEGRTDLQTDSVWMRVETFAAAAAAAAAAPAEDGPLRIDVCKAQGIKGKVGRPMMSKGRRIVQHTTSD